MTDIDIALNKAGVTFKSEHRTYTTLERVQRLAIERDYLFRQLEKAREAIKKGKEWMRHDPDCRWVMEGNAGGCTCGLDNFSASQLQNMKRTKPRKHTEGPLAALPRADGNYEIANADGDLLAMVYGKEGVPEMFAAVIDLLEALEAWDHWDYEVSSARANGESIYSAADFAEMREKARRLTQAAIAKAQGTTDQKGKE